MFLKCKHFLHHTVNNILRHMLLCILVLGLVFPLLPTQKAQAEDQIFSNQTLSSNRERLSVAIEEKTQQVLNLFKLLPNESKQQISGAILSALLEYNVFKKYLSSNLSIEDSFPKTIIQTQDGQNKNYYIITSNKLPKELNQHSAAIDKPEFTLLAEENSLNSAIEFEATSLGNTAENIDPITQEIENSITNNFEKERFSRLIKILNNVKCVAAIRFTGQALIITSSLMYINHLGFGPAFFKGLIGGGLSYLYAYYDNIVYPYLNAKKTEQDKRIDMLSSKIIDLKDQISRNTNDRTAVSNIENSILLEEIDNLTKKIRHLSTSKKNQLENDINFKFKFALTEFIFLGAHFAIVNASFFALNKKVWQPIFDHDFSPLQEFTSISDWALAIGLATMTQGTWDGQVSNFKDELLRTNMNPKKAQAIYASLRITGSLLSVSSAILAQSGSNWAASTGFLILIGVSGLLKLKSDSLVKQRISSLAQRRPDFSSQQCLSLY